MTAKQSDFPQSDFPLTSASQDAPDSDALRMGFVQMHRVWLELFSDPEWETDPRKRRAMLTARLAFQEAKLRYVFRAAPQGG